MKGPNMKPNNKNKSNMLDLLEVGRSTLDQFTFKPTALGTPDELKPLTAQLFELLEQKKVDQARQLAESIDRTTPMGKALNLNLRSLVEAHISVKNWSDAELLATQLLEVASDLESPWREYFLSSGFRRLSSIYHKQGDEERGYQYAIKALDACPNDSRNQANYLIYSYARQGDTKTREAYQNMKKYLASAVLSELQVHINEDPELSFLRS
jgi:hypothetical protein